MSSPTRSLGISAGFRLALATKGLLLATLAAAFIVFTASGAPRISSALGDLGWIVGASVGAVTTALGCFLAYAASLAWLDALLGHAVEERDAVALRSRKAGHSLRLAKGGFAEFILWNPWAALAPDRRYRIRIGRYSKVIVAAPELEPPVADA